MKAVSANTHPENDSLSGVGGWLLFLCISLTIITPIVTILSIVFFWIEVSPFFLINTQLCTATYFYIGMRILICAYGIHAGSQLWMTAPDGLNLAKTFLWISLAFGVFADFMFVFFSNLEATPDLPDFGLEMVAGAIKSPINFALWYGYLKKSKRVRNTFPQT